MRTLRQFLGLLFIIAGLVLLWRTWHTAERWGAEALGWPSLAASEEIKPPLLPTGLGLVVAGLAVGWVRRPKRVAPEPPVDIAPIVDWVQTFEHHEEELANHRKPHADEANFEAAKHEEPLSKAG